MTRLRRLGSKRNVRDAERIFIAEGTKVVEAALRAGVAIEAIYVDAQAQLSDGASSLLEVAEAKHIRVVGLAPGVIERVCDTVTPQPILAAVSFVDRPLATLVTGTALVLVDVRDPGNVGAIIRSSDAAGIDAIVLCDGCGDLYNPKTVRASAGSLFHIPTVRGGDPIEVLSDLNTKGFQTVATVARGGDDYAIASLSSPLALVLGNEAVGLGDDVLASCSSAVTVPISGGAESLNVAMAATVITFELARRRRHGGREALSMNP